MRILQSRFDSSRAHTVKQTPNYSGSVTVQARDMFVRITIAAVLVAIGIAIGYALFGANRDRQTPDAPIFKGPIGLPFVKGPGEPPPQ